MSNHIKKKNIIEAKVQVLVQVQRANTPQGWSVTYGAMWGACRGVPSMHEGVPSMQCGVSRWILTARL